MGGPAAVEPVRAQAGCVDVVARRVSPQRGGGRSPTIPLGGRSARRRHIVSPLQECAQGALAQSGQGTTIGKASLP